MEHSTTSEGLQGKITNAKFDKILEDLSTAKLFFLKRKLR